MERYSTPQRRPPTAVRVIAILNLIFGGLGLACSLCGTVTEWTGVSAQLQQMAEQNADPFQQRVREASETAQADLPANRLFTNLYLVSSIVCGGLLITSGVGLLRTAPSARRLAITYAILSALVSVIYLFYETLVRAPAVSNALDQLQPTTAEEQSTLSMMRSATHVAPIFGCLMLIYPIVVLIVMFLPTVRAAFREKQDITWGPDVFAR